MLFEAGADPKIENKFGISPEKLIREYNVPELSEFLVNFEQEKGSHPF